MYLFKTASFDSGKRLVDILPFFNKNRGIASKIIEAIIFCLLINGISFLTEYTLRKNCIFVRKVVFGIRMLGPGI